MDFAVELGPNLCVQPLNLQISAVAAAAFKLASSSPLLEDRTWDSLAGESFVEVASIHRSRYIFNQHHNCFNHRIHHKLVDFFLAHARLVHKHHFSHSRR